MTWQWDGMEGSESKGISRKNSENKTAAHER